MIAKDVKAIIPNEVFPEFSEETTNNPLNGKESAIMFD